MRTQTTSIRCALGRLMPQLPASTDELRAMRAAAWHKQGIVVVPLEDIYDDWDRAVLSGIATKLYGARTVASRKSTPWAEGEVIDRLLVIVLLTHIVDHAAIRPDAFIADARLLLGTGLGALRLLGHGRPAPSCPRVASTPSRSRCTVIDLPVVATTVQVSPSPRSMTSPSDQGVLLREVAVRAP